MMRSLASGSAKLLRSSLRRVAFLCAPLVATCLIGMSSAGCAGNSDTPGTPRAFSSPDEAAIALADAIRADDTNALLAIMGTEGEQIVSSGDEFDDRSRRQTFLALYEKKHALANEGPDLRTLVVGEASWPFPVPIVRDGESWFFDAEAGREEILNRRIGEHELAAIQVCKAIGDAQQEYAMMDPDRDGVREFARKFVSDPDTRNGLFWRSGEGESPSPLGDMAAAASAEGYSRRAEGPTPYHGYYYRVLEAQGPDAPGGAVQYVVNGKMILGFGVLAYPAEYGSSGITTFIMNAEGTVYQKDLGADTAKLVAEIRAFDPGPGWTLTDRS